MLAAGLAAVGVLIYVAFKLMHRARIERRGPALPEGWKNGLPGVLYFTSEECSPCRTQGRTVERGRDGLGGEVNLVKVNVDEEPELAEKWSVLTVPTTVVVDDSGRVGEVNHGVVSEKKLRHQLEGVS